MNESCKGCKCYKQEHQEPGDYFICDKCLPDNLYDMFKQAVAELDSEAK